jgi:hypothetical protein
LVSHHDVRITEPPDQPSPVTPGMIADTPQHS